MAKAGKDPSTEASPPKKYIETTPPSYPSYDPSHILQSVIEMQKSIGMLTQAVTTLTEESKKNSEKLDKISHKIYAAQVVIGIAGGGLALIGSGLFILFCKIWDAISPIIQLKPHP